MAKQSYLLLFSAMTMALSPLSTIAAETEQLPAVDQVNSKLSFSGGSDDTAAGDISITFPVGHEFGGQVDLGRSTSDNGNVNGVGGHFFWRDPSTGLLGIYGSRHDGNNLERNTGGIQAEKFYERFTLRGKVGYEKIERYSWDESGNSGSLSSTWYATDNLGLHLRAAQVESSNTNGLGFEWQFNTTNTSGYSLFAEASHNEYTDWTNTVGVRVYLDKPKSLKSRHRTSDPESAVVWADPGYGCPYGYYVNAFIPWDGDGLQCFLIPPGYYYDHPEPPDPWDGQDGQDDD